MHLFFFFNDTATTEIYTLSLHDALPILEACALFRERLLVPGQLFEARLLLVCLLDVARDQLSDRKSTRLNSSHANISYAVFCLKKKKPRTHPRQRRPGHSKWRSYNSSGA